MYAIRSYYDLIYAETSDFDKIDGLTEVGTVNKGNFTYTVKNLERNTTYYFAVVVEDQVGNKGSLSKVVSGIPVDKTSPSRVTGLKVESYADQLIFSWNPVIADDLKGYRITFDQVTEPDHRL